MTREERLHALLGNMFSGDELRTHLAVGRDGDSLTKALAGAGASTDVLIASAIAQLKRHRLVDHEFFDGLELARPRWAAEIQSVRELWLPRPSSSISLHPALDPEASQSTVRLTGDASGSNLSQKRWFSLRLKLGPLMISIAVAIAALAWGIYHLIPTDPRDLRPPIANDPDEEDSSDKGDKKPVKPPAFLTKEKGAIDTPTCTPAPSDTVQTAGPGRRSAVLVGNCQHLRPGQTYRVELEYLAALRDERATFKARLALRLCWNDALGGCAAEHTSEVHDVRAGDPKNSLTSADSLIPATVADEGAADYTVMVQYGDGAVDEFDIRPVKITITELPIGTRGGSDVHEDMGDSGSEPDRPAKKRRDESDEADPARVIMELEALSAAKDSLKSDPLKSLVYVYAHDKEFPASQLTDQFDEVKIKALCRLGRASEARTEAATILRQRPNSRVAAAVAQCD